MFQDKGSRAQGRAAVAVLALCALVQPQEGVAQEVNLGQLAEKCVVPGEKEADKEGLTSAPLVNFASQLSPEQINILSQHIYKALTGNEVKDLPQARQSHCLDSIKTYLIVDLMKGQALTGEQKILAQSILLSLSSQTKLQDLLKDCKKDTLGEFRNPAVNLIVLGLTRAAISKAIPDLKGHKGNIETNPVKAFDAFSKITNDLFKSIQAHFSELTESGLAPASLAISQKNALEACNRLSLSMQALEPLLRSPARLTPESESFVIQELAKIYGRLSIARRTGIIVDQGPNPLERLSLEDLRTINKALKQKQVPPNIGTMNLSDAIESRWLVSHGALILKKENLAANLADALGQL